MNNKSPEIFSKQIREFDPIQIIVNQRVQFLPHGYSSAHIIAVTFLCSLRKACNRRNVTLGRPDDLAYRVLIRLLHKAVTAALSAVLRSGFESLPLDRIEGQYDLRNPASRRVMEKLGMTYEKDVILTKLDGSDSYPGEEYRRLFR